ncbi:metalloregulator ArsR/SmtB family transcription factor [uncultured Microbacterium sp.]|jgi:DNA-binding transcriptional ArsR family regulator|uniref:ArsR/SmtB family transcription factor n=1 Tax=uncultured Microbacterium sp. TaxID=191216 RepID=UPI0025CC5D16|nr:metalloregulator ArsR/SmtB family transcription factor [uncultured Microbacterium sp.]
MPDIFDVIADGTRREILQLLRDALSSGDGVSVSHIVTELSVSQPTVSKHLKVLRESGLVTVREEGQHRFYSLESAPLSEIEDWLVPFFDDSEGMDAEIAQLAAAAAARSLPEPAAHAAEVVGRAAASAKHAWDSAIKRIPGL